MTEWRAGVGPQHHATNTLFWGVGNPGPWSATLRPGGGYKKSGIGRETHKMMLDHYQQMKNVLVSYSTKALGFF
jgi:acyl-CoA reductase-like NAD-dependent aldehyde dehydrogenase